MHGILGKQQKLAEIVDDVLRVQLLKVSWTSLQAKTILYSWDISDF